jgi:hypothetical protein
MALRQCPERLGQGCKPVLMRKQADRQGGYRGPVQVELAERRSEPGLTLAPDPERDKR